MGTVTRDEVVALLRRDNPGARADEVALYADCFLDYQEAVNNIRDNGNIVVHPRTGAPIDNPYLKVKAQAMAGLLKITRSSGSRRALFTDGLWGPEQGQAVCGEAETT